MMSESALEEMRARMMALQRVPERPSLHASDLLAALAFFLIVVASTFPVVLPFALGRYAGYGSWKVGLMMAGLGVALVAAIMALGG